MSAHRPVPLGCRRAGHFLLKESGQRNVPLRSRPLRGFAAACGARRSPSLACGARACLGSRIVRSPSPALGSCRGRSAPRGLPTAGRKRVASPLALALRADPFGVRRAEGGEKPQSKRSPTGAEDQERECCNHPSLERHLRPGLPCGSASPTGAEDQEPGLATIRPWDGMSGPAFLGRAFAGRDATGIAPELRLTPRGGAAPAGAARTRRANGPRAPRGGRLSLVPFFGGAKKGTRSVAAERNRTMCRSRARNQTPRWARGDNRRQVPQASGGFAMKMATAAERHRPASHAPAQRAPRGVAFSLATFSWPNKRKSPARRRRAEAVHLRAQRESRNQRAASSA